MFDMFQSTLTAKGLSNALTSTALGRLGVNGATAADASQFSQKLKTSLDAAASSAATEVGNAVNATEAALAQYQSTLRMYTVGRTVAEQPASAASTNTTTVAKTGSSKLQQDFQAYFDTAAPGSTMQAGGGTVTRNVDGTATWANGTESYTYSRETPLNVVAAHTGLGAEWAVSYADDAASVQATVAAPFTDFNGFKAWESDLGNTFATNYEAPDYVHMMGLSLGGGEGDAFKRYLFFKNNPQYAADFQAIHQGELSKFPTDGSTLVRSDVSQMPIDVAEKYRQNPESLRMAEGLSMDPVLYQQRVDGKLDVPSGVNATEWLMQHKWTSSGVVANDNRVTFAAANYVGMSGSGSDTYRMVRYGQGTGQIIDFDGSIYDPTTGQKTGQASTSTLTALYGSGSSTA